MDSGGCALCFVPFPHYDLAILQMLPGGTDSLCSLHRKVGAPSQTRRHESLLSENALSFGQLSRGPVVCVCAGLVYSSCWDPDQAFWLGCPQGKSKDFCYETPFFSPDPLAGFMFAVVIFFDWFIAVISRR